MECVVTMMMMTTQVKIVEKGLQIHQKLASYDILPLHQLMEDKFAEMVDGIEYMVRTPLKVLPF